MYHTIGSPAHVRLNGWGTQDNFVVRHVVDNARLRGDRNVVADIDVAYSQGFSPKPNMEFAPALPLGVSSFGELADVVIVSELSIADIHERLREVSPEGLTFTGCWDLEERAKGLSKLIERYEVLIGIRAVKPMNDE